MKYIADISEISEKYDVFLVDLYGVVHNGSQAYPEAVHALQFLRAQNKRVILFSNSPRASDAVQQQLTAMSVALSDFKITTSGDFFAHVLQNPEKHKLSFMSGKGFALNQDLNHHLLKSKNLRLSDKLEEAQYIITMAFTPHKAELEMFDVQMKKAIILDLPCICPNPDLIAHQGDTVLYTAGSFAARYAEMGGKVHYMGKPESAFYKFALQDDTGNALGVGDNFNTDILGANCFGIDSLFIQSGVHKGELVEELITKTNIKPNYILNYLKI